MKRQTVLRYSISFRRLIQASQGSSGCSHASRRACSKKSGSTSQVSRESGSGARKGFRSFGGLACSTLPVTDSVPDGVPL